MQDFLGGWWDARLADARTGSSLEGGLRFLVEEHYPGDPLDPNPTTWVPFVFYGPQPYPFQTPQVMVRARPEWTSPPRRVAVGDVVEAIDDSEEDDTVLWRGVVHKEKGKDSVRRACVLRCSNAGGLGLAVAVAGAVNGTGSSRSGCDVAPPAVVTLCLRRLVEDAFTCQHFRRLKPAWYGGVTQPPFTCSCHSCAGSHMQRHVSCRRPSVCKSPAGSPAQVQYTRPGPSRRACTCRRISRQSYHRAGTPSAGQKRKACVQPSAACLRWSAGHATCLSLHACFVYA